MHTTALLLLLACSGDPDPVTDDSAVAGDDSGADTEDTHPPGGNIDPGVACTTATDLGAGDSILALECRSGFCGGVMCASLGGPVSVCLGEPCGMGCEEGWSCVGFLNPASSRCVPTNICEMQ